jgi:hypothetical protein
MKEQAQPVPEAGTVHAELQEVAALLRQASHLEPAVQQRLAEVVEDFGRAIRPDAAPSAEMIHLAQDLAQLVRSLHRQEEAPLRTAGKRLRQAIARVEAQSPFVTEIVRRLLDALANIGI